MPSEHYLQEIQRQLVRETTAKLMALDRVIALEAQLNSLIPPCQDCTVVTCAGSNSCNAARNAFIQVQSDQRGTAGMIPMLSTKIEDLETKLFEANFLRELADSLFDNIKAAITEWGADEAVPESAINEIEGILSNYPRSGNSSPQQEG